MDNLLNELVLTNKQGIVIKNESDKNIGLKEENLLKIMKKLSGYGYKLDSDALNRLYISPEFSEEDILDAFDKFFVTLRGLFDAKETNVVFFPNFPEEVLNTSDSVRLIKQLAHYLFGYIPESVEKSSDLVETKSYEDLRELHLYNDCIYKEILINYLETTVALSPIDKEYLVELLSYYSDKDLSKVLKDVSIKNKETLALVLAHILDNKRNINGNYLVKIPRDMLRLMSVLSGSGDMLSKDTEFREFNKQELNFIYSTLNNIVGKEEDFKLKQFRNLWTSFFKENKFSSKKYPVLDRYVKIAFNKISYKTYDEKLNTSMKKMQDDPSRDTVLSVVNLIKLREGVFARNLDTILRSASEVSYTLFKKVLIEFEKVAYNIDSKVLVQLRNRVMNIENEDLPRLVSIKGSYTELDYKKFSEKSKGNYSVSDILDVIDNTLIRIYSEREDIGNVILDKRAKDIVVSTSEKGKSSQIRPMFTGSKVYLPKESNYLRVFVSWKNGMSGRLDIDSSASLLDESFENEFNVYYADINSGIDYGVLHSGDMVDAPNGATEFIDIDVDKFRNSGHRYLLHDVRIYSSFNGGTFDVLQENNSDVRAGVMALDKSIIFSNEQNYNDVGKLSKDFYEASVETGFSLMAKSNSVQTVLIDLKDLSYTWLDISVRRVRRATNIVSERSDLKTILNYIVNRKATTLYDVYKLNALARGTVVNEKDFSEDDKQVKRLGNYNENDVLDKLDILSNWL